MDEKTLIRKYRTESIKLVDLKPDNYYVLSTEGLVILGEFMSHDGDQVILHNSLIFSEKNVDTPKNYQQVDFSSFHCEPATRSSLKDLETRVANQKDESAKEAFYAIYTILIDLDLV